MLSVLGRLKPTKLLYLFGRYQLLHVTILTYYIGATEVERKQTIHVIFYSMVSIVVEYMLLLVIDA